MLKARSKRCVFGSFLNNTNVRLSTDVFGNEFHTAGPACEKARSKLGTYLR